MISTAGSWYSKFAVAFRGLFLSLRDQASFRVHLPCAATIVALAVYLQLESWRWAILMLCITTVLSAELMNTSIERLVKVLHPEPDQRIGDVLDTAAAAVLVASIGAAVTGIICLAGPLFRIIP